MKDFMFYFYILLDNQILKFMKKITFVLALLTFGMQAQTFPSPYCDMADNGALIEEITLVDFDGTEITNSDASILLIDATATVVTVNPGETYVIKVEGNTHGAFDDDIVAFIDWNQNNVLDDAGEIYELGTLTDSEGNDGISVIFNITVPTDAVLGTTRIRITKSYQDPDSPAEINPCAIEFYPFGYGPYEGYGQALDFTLEVEAFNPGPFPAPYCDMADNGALIEEITLVDFDGTEITNSDASILLIDATATVVNVTPGETYVIKVEGNTHGAFDDDIVAFIDWNQNNVLDDAGEIYELGTLTDSEGNDGISVIFNITVPMDAVVGTTRIRITKSYQDPDSPAEINPCAIEFYPFGYGPYEGYGQALDFSLNIGALSVKTFDANALSVYPNPVKDLLNITYKSELNQVKIYNLLGQEVYLQNTTTSRLQLDLSSLAAGAYLVKLFTQEGAHNFRIIKR